MSSNNSFFDEDRRDFREPIRVTQVGSQSPFGCLALIFLALLIGMILLFYPYGHTWGSGKHYDGYTHSDKP